MQPIVALTPEAIARRRKYSRIWAASTISWSLLRTTVVWATLGKYGVNPWRYMMIDLSSAGGLALTAPRLVTSLIDRLHRKAAIWGVATFVAYSVPDLYIFLSTDRLPTVVLVILLSVIYISIAVGIVGLRRKVKAGRALRAKADLHAVT